MDTSKLYAGQIVKNYKELCELLDEKVKGGNSKKYQMKEMEKLFEYKKDGNKFEIIKVYSNKEIQERVKSDNKKSVYSEIVQLLIMDALSVKKGHVIMTKTNLMKSIGLIGDNYSLGFKNQMSLSRYLDINIANVNDFYNINNSSLNSMIKIALDSLQSKRIIDYQDDTIIKYKDSKYPHLATPIDRSILLKIDKQCMEEFGIKSLEELNSYNKNKDYFNLINRRKELLNTLTNIEYHYRVLDIVINEKYIEQEKNDLAKHILEELTRLDMKSTLNNLFLTNSIVNAKKRHENNPNNLRKKESYVEYFEILAKELIDFNSETIEMSKLKQSKSKQILSMDILNEIENLPF